MAEEVCVSSDGTYILVRSTGSPSLQEMKQTLSRIAEIYRDHKLDLVLVDSRARHEQPSVADIFKGGEMLAKTLGYITRIAVLVGEITADHALFENVAVNRGSVVAYFQDEAKALRWLTQSD